MGFETLLIKALCKVKSHYETSLWDLKLSFVKSAVLVYFYYETSLWDLKQHITEKRKSPVDYETSLWDLKQRQTKLINRSPNLIMRHPYGI